ncbi:MAG: periplasmic heavy metal sensor [Rhodospirillaceae bacterium]|nr:periplasmic heavy metal sensor [Rhodospirillaceae bacterium]
MVSLEGRSRWFSLVLMLSIAGNLFLGGIVAARWINRPDLSMGPPQGPQVALRGVPREYRKAIEDVFAAKRPEMASALEATRQARNMIREALGAEPFNAAVLQTAYATLRERSMTVQQKYNDATVEAAAKLPAEVRKAMAAARPGNRPPGEGR